MGANLKYLAALLYVKKCGAPRLYAGCPDSGGVSMLLRADFEACRSASNLADALTREAVVVAKLIGLRMIPISRTSQGRVKKPQGTRPHSSNSFIQLYHAIQCRGDGEFKFVP